MLLGALHLSLLDQWHVGVMSCDNERRVLAISLIVMSKTGFLSIAISSISRPGHVIFNQREHAWKFSFHSNDSLS